MPASMMSEESGSSPKVIGSSMAMVGIGPMPGSTPISVPSRQPMRAKPRFLSETAAPKPVARFWKRSSSILTAPPGRQRLSQHVDEDQHSEQRQPDTEHDRFERLHVVPRVGGEHRQCHGGEREADRIDQKPEDQDGRDDEADRAQLNALDRRPLDGHPLKPQNQPDDDDQYAEQGGEVAWPHAGGRSEGELPAEIKPGDTDRQKHQPRPEILGAFHPQHAVSSPISPVFVAPARKLTLIRPPATVNGSAGRRVGHRPMWRAAATEEICWRTPPPVRIGR